MKKSVLAAFVCLCLPAFAVSAQQGAEAEEVKQLIGKQLAQVRSVDDLVLLESQGSPYLLLSADARQRFTDSLVFNENGLVSLYYTDLEQQLSLSQIYRLLGMFGEQKLTAMMTAARVVSPTDKLIQQQLMQLNKQQESGDQGRAVMGPFGPPGDHKEYRCVEHGTCHTAGGYICMSGC